MHPRGTARRALRLALPLAALLLLAVPAAASAANLYVDDGGSDAGANTCAVPSNPCGTITYALTQTAAGETLFVGGGIYDSVGGESFPLSLDDGRSLQRSNFNSPATSGRAIIDGGGDIAVAVPVAGAGTISGLTLRGTEGLQVKGPVASISGNVFDESADNAVGLEVNGDGLAPSVSGNTFQDSSPDDTGTAIDLLNGAAPTVSGSTITGYARAIDISGGSSPVITGNHIAGAHDDSGTGFGVVVQDSTATITGNVIDAPAGAVFGVSVIEESGPTAAAATLKRNRIIGSGAAGSGGVASSNSQGLVTLDGDIIAGWDVGLLGTDVLPDNPDVGDMDATNVTVADNATNQAQLNATKLTLDSSIIGDGGAPFGGLLGTCTADYSRLPATNPCTATNPTSDPPLFVNPAGRDYHLQAGSTLIDAGNPAAPADPIDFDGDPRVMDGPDLGGCYLTDLADTAVRDIGADEHNCVPRTFVTKAPPSVTSTDTIKFKFRSDDPAATFQCKKDKKRYKPCSSPWVRHYGIGTHLVQIRAVDAQGQKDATPAKRRFRVV